MQSSGTISQQIGSFAESFEIGAAPNHVIHRIKTAILDVIGDASGGLIRPVPRLTVETIAEISSCTLDGPDQARVWHTGRRLPLPYAATSTTALVCGADYSYGPVAEIGAGVIPAVVATGEAMKLSGRDVLKATIVGHEVLFRFIGITSAQKLQSNGFYHSGVQNPPAAAAAAAIALGLGADGVSRAVSLSAELVNGTMAMFGEGAGKSKYYVVGQATGNGVMAALLARAGYPPPQDIIERFYYPTFGDDEVTLEAEFADLGETYLSEYIRFKLNPACLHTHTAIEAAHRFVTETGLAGGEIESIDVAVSTIADELVGHWRPVNDLVEAQYSIPFLVAFVITSRRRPRVEDFTRDTISDPEIKGLMKRVQVRRSNELDLEEGYGARPPFNNPCEFAVKHSGGNEWSTKVERPRGTYPDLPDDEVVFSKFADQMSLHYEKSTVDRVIDMVMNLEQLGDIGALVDEISNASVEPPVE